MFRTGCEVRRGKTVHRRVNQTILRSRSAQKPLHMHASYFCVFFFTDDNNDDDNINNNRVTAFDSNEP